MPLQRAHWSGFILLLSTLLYYGTLCWWSLHSLTVDAVLLNSLKQGWYSKNSPQSKLFSLLKWLLQYFKPSKHLQKEPKVLKYLWYLPIIVLSPRKGLVFFLQLSCKTIPRNGLKHLQVQHCIAPTYHIWIFKENIHTILLNQKHKVNHCLV